MTGVQTCALPILNAAVNEMAKKPEIREKLAGLGLQPLPGSDKDTADFVAREIAKNRKTIEATGIKRE